LVLKPEGKRLLGRTGHILQDNIKIELLKCGGENVDWTGPRDCPMTAFREHGDRLTGYIKVWVCFDWLSEY
jgi:hypothetical protein